MNHNHSHRFPRRDFLRSITTGVLGAKPLVSGLAGLLGAEQILAADVVSPNAESTPRNFGDLGNGTYKNPVIMAGDIADLSIIREGRDYYLVHGYYCAPGFIIWHSRDLVNWEPVKKLRPESGPGGPDISKCGDRYYIYYGARSGLNVIHAAHPLAEWSDPVSLGINAFDPTHIICPDGRRFILSGSPTGYLYELAPDGLSVINGSRQEFNYDGWPIPENWDVECFCLEGWNTAQKNGYYYVLAAEGGTSGPPTSHMCVVARAKSLDGPWENSPYNPVVHTYNRDEAFWSKGQGVLVDTPRGDWYILYHAYLKNAENLGRQVCLEPVEWTHDNWFRISRGIIVDQPIHMPLGGEVVPNGFKPDDNFRGPELDVKWGFTASSASGRYRFVKDGLALQAFGSGIADAVPMVMPVTHRAYEFVVEMTVPPGAEGGATIYASERVNAMVSLNDGRIRCKSLIAEELYPATYKSERIFFRAVFQNNILQFYFGADGKNWTKMRDSFDVTCFNRNTFGGVEAVRPGMFASGAGEIILHNFTLRGLA